VEHKVCLLPIGDHPISQAAHLEAGSSQQWFNAGVVRRPEH